ncbi:hydrolase/acyltransferase [Paenibacillus sambharensis]|uniref:Hydrolase/acyltransferase n=1 Tax=Paenibacillus sambharensis TaxID=1803190 RepID=A0A2W1L938_9BACL|nr:hydrolase/acyltransferase [Paenibacillus sambharensis]PZD94650.1 hydrolase/acyltransferase [Paenibacillus sambharensis]
MPTMRYIIMQSDSGLSFVEMPASHAYQLSALNLRLHKELDKLTAANVPVLPYAVAECAELELHNKSLPVTGGLDYMNELERQFAGIKEHSYPLISLLTEIRALQAQLEQWYEEEMEF